MHELSGSRAEQLCNQLLDKIADLEDRVAELESKCDQQREDHHAVARENHELRASHEQLEERIEKTEEKDGLLLDDIIDLEQQLADMEAGSAGSKDGGDVDETTMQQVDMTPIERLHKMDTGDTGIDVTPSIERAVSIYDHWKEWSNKTPKGRVVKDGLKNLLRTATGEGLAWRQVYRACEALEELSKGRIEFIDHRKHGKMLVESEPARGGHCQSSSVATS